MFVLFGLGKETRKDYGPTIPVVCPRCHNPTHLRLVEVKKWFTLFLIPILPYDTTYLLQCDICSRAVELNDAQFERAKRLCRAARDLRDERISEERYRTIVQKSRLLEFTTRRKVSPKRDEE